MFMAALPMVASAQNSVNIKVDSVGKLATQIGDQKFKISELTVSGDVNGTDLKLLQEIVTRTKTDKKNPDEKLRNTPCDQIVLFSGLEYNAKKKRWDGTKIYDPQRGMRANLTVEFDKDGRLKLRGSILGIGETVYWTKVKEK